MSISSDNRRRQPSSATWDGRAGLVQFAAEDGEVPRVAELFYAKIGSPPDAVFPAVAGNATWAPGQCAHLKGVLAILWVRNQPLPA